MSPWVVLVCLFFLCPLARGLGYWSGLRSYRKGKING